jgi:hypothetical protein
MMQEPITGPSSGQAFESGLIIPGAAGIDAIRPLGPGEQQGWPSLQGPHNAENADAPAIVRPLGIGPIRSSKA